MVYLKSVENVITFRPVVFPLSFQKQNREEGETE